MNNYYNNMMWGKIISTVGGLVRDNCCQNHLAGHLHTYENPLSGPLALMTV